MWGFWLKFAVTPVIVLIGATGNTLAIIVMKSKALRRKSYSHYLCALAVFDTITLAIRQIRTVDDYYIDILNTHGLFQNFSNASCKVFNLVEHVCYLMSSWLIVVMAVERFVVVCFPFKTVVIRQQMCAAFSICSLLGILSVTQLFRVLMVENIVIDFDIGIRICGAADEFLYIYSNLSIYFYSLTLMFVLPVATVILCNCLVLAQIYRVRRNIQSNHVTRYDRAIESKYRTTCMLLIVSFTYIITLMPLFTLTIFVDMSVKAGSTDYKLITDMWPFIELCATISLINYACNFFIYVLSGKKFRFELGKLCHKTRTRKIVRTRSSKEEFVRL